MHESRIGETMITSLVGWAGDQDADNKINSSCHREK